MMARTARHVLWAIGALAAVAVVGSSLAAQEPRLRRDSGAAFVAETTVVYLVRHAEVAPDGTPDPPLAVAGEARAERLRDVLAGVRLTGIFSTDLRRTRSTAGPIAEASGLPLSFYTPPGMAGLADSLARTPGRFLVVGHSNTTPYMVELLGGDPGVPMGEDEFDRLYIVTLPAGGAPRTEVRRYRP